MCRTPTPAAIGCTGHATVTSRSTPRRSTGGSSVPLTYDPSGLPDDVLADFPQLVDYEAFRLRRTDLRKVPEILTGQLAVASYSPGGSLHDATGVQIPGVLDDLYRRHQRALGVTWKHGKPTLRVWAPTARR